MGVFKDLMEKWTCKHEWEQYNRMKVYPEEGGNIPTRVEDTLICKKCGKITKIKL